MSIAFLTGRRPKKSAGKAPKGKKAGKSLMASSTFGSHSHAARVMPKTGILDITIILRCVLCPYQFHEVDGSLLCPP